MNKTKWRGVLLTLAASASLVRADPAAEGVTNDSATTAPAVESAAQRDARMAWWRDAKFGLFIHWGVYAVPAGSYGGKTTYGEWIMNSAKIPVETYQHFAQQFNPIKYNPADWADLARDAGMKYVVITAKHHDGFALYPSKASAWNVADATPYKKDLLGPLVSAVHANGLKMGFYYSQSQDWTNPGGAKSGFKEGEGWDEAHKGDYDQYLANVAVPQVRELLTNYPIDVLWWDTPMHMTPQRARPLADLLKLRPGIVTNNRLGGPFSGDHATPEQFVPVTGFPGDWETCMTMNDHWGYNAQDKHWKSSADLIRKLAEVASKGGNFLLNVGPTADGEIPPESISRLREIGQWLKVNGESIYSTSRGPFSGLSYGYATRRDNRLYLHVTRWPSGGLLRVPLLNAGLKAYLLARPQEPLSATREENRWAIKVPDAAPDAVDTVVVLQLDCEPAVAPPITSGATAIASESADGTSPEFVFDGTNAKRWRAKPETKSAWIEVKLPKPATVSRIGLDEPDVWPRMKQTYSIEVQRGEKWEPVGEGKTAGHGAIFDITPIEGQVFRVTMTCAAGQPGIAELRLYSPE